jgi:GNAT superfamily N-acetyltransferase
MEYEAIQAFDERLTQELHALYQHEWWSRGRTLEQVRTILAHTDYHFGLTEKDTGRLAAFSRVLSDRIYKAIIFDVIVAKDHRRKGLGKRLMTAICDHPELRAVKHFELYCLPDLIPFYRSLGFTTDTGGVALMRKDGLR